MCKTPHGHLTRVHHLIKLWNMDLEVDGGGVPTWCVEVAWCTSVLFWIFNKARWEPRTSSSELSVCYPLLSKMHCVWRAGQEEEETAWPSCLRSFLLLFASVERHSPGHGSTPLIFPYFLCTAVMYVNHPDMPNLYSCSQIVVYFISDLSLHETLTGHICSVPQVTEISSGAPHHSQSFVFLLPPNSSMAICSEPPKKTE